MINIKRIFYTVQSSFWFLPAIYGLAALVAVGITTTLDLKYLDEVKKSIPDIFLANADVSKGLYSALTTAILTMTTISFSTIMVVLTTYSSQFSPRTLQDFMRSRSPHHVLGAYTFGFLFALVNLLLVSKGDQFFRPITMIIAAVFGLALFIYFIHMTSKQIQVNALIEKIHKDGNRLIDRSYNEAKHNDTEVWDGAELTKLENADWKTVHAQDAGYIQDIEWKELFKWAEKEDAIIKVHANIGEYLIQGEPLISVLSNDQGKYKRNTADALLSYAAVGTERNDVQDVEFALEKIVEIALRAISPGINDPHTAINCINRIGSLLVEIGKKNRNIHYLANDEWKLRVIKPSISFDHYLYRCFYQIKHYGSEDVSILYSMLDILAKVASVSDESVRSDIWNYHYEILAVFDWNALSNQDYLRMREVYERLTDVCGKNEIIQS